MTLPGIVVGTPVQLPPLLGGRTIGAPMIYNTTPGLFLTLGDCIPITSTGSYNSNPEVNYFLPSMAQGVQPGALCYLVRAESTTALNFARAVDFLPCPSGAGFNGQPTGDQMCGQAASVASKIGIWRLVGAGDWVVLLALSGSTPGTLSWWPVSSSSSAKIYGTTAGLVANTPVSAGLFLPPSGKGAVKTVTAQVTNGSGAITAGNVVISANAVIGNTQGTPPSTTLSVGSQFNSSWFPPYYGNVGDPSSPSQTNVNISPSNTYAGGPSVTWCIEYW